MRFGGLETAAKAAFTMMDSRRPVNKPFHSHLQVSAAPEKMAARILSATPAAET
jgi:hypothetical protein